MAEPWVHILGNQDRESEDQNWLGALQPSAAVAGDVLLCHGSPRSDMEYLLEDVDSSGTHLASAETILSRLEGASAPLILCGHTHIPRFVMLPGGGCIANPGSVGLQAYTDTAPVPHFMETGSPHARYALLDRTKSGWQATFIAVEYDWESASAKAKTGGRPDWAWALRTGFTRR